MRTNRPQTGSVVCTIILILMTFICQTVNALAKPIVYTDKDIYKVGESIIVSFSESPGINSDWMCIVTAGSPDDEAGEYKYMPQGLAQGVLIFDAPQPGKYEARVYYNYRRNGYVVSARYSFHVLDGSSPVISKKISNSKKIKTKQVQKQDKSDTTHSLTKLAGQGNRMVGEIMEKIGKENEGTAMGDMLLIRA